MTGLLTLSNLLAWSAQAALVAAAALLAVRLFRLDEPAARYALLRAVLLVVLLLPAISVALVGSRAGDARAAGTVTAGVAFAPADRASQGAGTRSLALVGAWAGSIAVILLAGALARLGWLALGVVRLRGLRRAGEVAAPDAGRDELQAIVGTRASVRFVKGLGQPVTFGFRSPVVLLPQSLQAQHPGIQRAVLAHELWHVKRRDWMWTVVEEGVRAVLWFHPAVWMLVSRIQAAREEVVDQLAILSTGSRRGYLDALLAYADERPLFTATAFAQRRHLVHRMVLITREAVMSSKRVVASSAAVALVVLLFGWQAVRAFPLEQAPGQSDLAAWSAPAGPVELKANDVTPENPIPRRTHFVPPDYPAEAAAIDAHALAGLRVTLDEAGHLVEVRGIEMSVRADGLSFSFSRGLQEGAGSGLSRGYAVIDRLPEGRARGLRAALEAFAAAAIRSARQWQYDRPVEGPLSFEVHLLIGEERGEPFARTALGPSQSLRWTRSVPQRPAEADGPDPVQEVEPEPLRVGGNIKAPTKIKHVNPEYPQDAKDAGVSGIIILEARIGPDGTVEDARVLRSIPLLDKAALDAVTQWQFVPTLLNGNPVPVIMTVTVNFTLQ